MFKRSRCNSMLAHNNNWICSNEGARVNKFMGKGMVYWMHNAHAHANGKKGNSSSREKSFRNAIDIEWHPKFRSTWSYLNARKFSSLPLFLVKHLCFGEKARKTYPYIYSIHFFATLNLTLGKKRVYSNVTHNGHINDAELCSHGSW